MSLDADGAADGGDVPCGGLEGRGGHPGCDGGVYGEAVGRGGEEGDESSYKLHGDDGLVRVCSREDDKAYRLCLWLGFNSVEAEEVRVDFPRQSAPLCLVRACLLANNFPGI